MNERPVFNFFSPGPGDGSLVDLYCAHRNIAHLWLIPLAACHQADRPDLVKFCLVQHGIHAVSASLFHQLATRGQMVDAMIRQQAQS